MFLILKSEPSKDTHRSKCHILNSPPITVSEIRSSWCSFVPFSVYNTWFPDEVRVFCPQGLVVAIGAANFALSEVQADFLHRKGYNLMFILYVVIKAIGYLLCAVSVISSFFYELCIWA